MTTPRSNQKRFKRDPLVPASDPIPNATLIWHTLAPLDEAARAAESRWGVERLPALVSEKTATKFGAAREHLDNLLNGDPPAIADVQAAAENVRRGWAALDAEATASGASAFDPIAWPLVVGGKPACIVRDPAAATQEQMLDPLCPVYTLDEIGKLLDVAMHSIAPDFPAKAKGLWPGATVAIKPIKSTVHDIADDEIPF